MCNDIVTAISKDDSNVVAVTVENDFDSRNYFYMVKAESAEHAIKVVQNEGINLDGHDFHSDYDCTGIWFANPVNVNEVEYSELMGMFIIPMYWRKDV